MSASTWAQGANGAITGVVKDASGAVVPDVGLTLRNAKSKGAAGAPVGWIGAGNGRFVVFAFMGVESRTQRHERGRKSAHRLAHG